MNVIDIQREIYDTVQKEKMLRDKLDDKTTELETIIERLNDSTKSFFEVKTDTVFTDCFAVKLYDFDIDIEKLVNEFKDSYIIKLYVKTQKELDDNEYTYVKLMFCKKED